MAKLSPIGNDAQFINGIPANGAKLFTYASGSSTKQTTYTGEDGLTPQSNPIILDSRGEPSQPIWLTEGLEYKFVFASSTDTDPPSSPIWDIDNITGVNDASLTVDQWVISGITPTYINATTFTMPGDQTTEFQVNRRIKLSVTAGTVYGSILTSAYAALTTVTVQLDSGVLDAGLSSVSLGLITPTNTSLFLIGTANIADDAITAAKIADGVITDKIQSVDATVAANALTVTISPTSLDFRSSTLTSGAVNTRTVSSAISCLVPSGATLGTINAVQSRIAILAIDNAGTVEAAVVNIAGGNDLSETGVISTTALSTGSDSANVIYSTTARTNVPYRVVGYVDSTQATAGTWATAPSTIQGYGGQALATMSSLGYGQTWQDVTGSRATSTTYYNTTGKPILVNIHNEASSVITTLVINGVTVQKGFSGASSYASLTGIVPPNGSYSITGTLTSAIWAELR